MIRDDFTQEEWQALIAAPSMVGMAVIAASPNHLVGVMKEIFAISMSFVDLIKQHSGNALIQAVVDDVRKRETKLPRPEFMTRPEEARQYALEQVRRAAAVLDAKVAETEGREYRKWLVSVAERVAHAAKEGGFLGFGGEEVSSDEEAAIEELKDILKES